ncbi:MAG: hypothetical protein IKT82_00085 [Bacteroidaceae bacterium]|nr:hypothetical protein [Bacteroidaceae bacterium]
MKKILTTIALAIFCVAGFSQAKKPQLMVVPSDNWHKVNNFYTEKENIGKKEFVPDYERAFIECSDLGNAIQAVNDLLKDREFVTKDMKGALDKLKANATEDMADNLQAEESLLDIVKKRVKSDIIVNLNWQVKAFGLRKVVDVQLQALDAYTSSPIASLQSQSEPAASFDLASALRECLAGGFDAFCDDMMRHFEDMATNGREINLHVQTEAGSDIDLQNTEINGELVGDFVEAWLTENCVNGSYNTVDATDTMMNFEQVRIPLFNEKGVAIDARKFLTNLRNLFREAGFSGTKVKMRGLGDATIYIAN